MKFSTVKNSRNQKKKSANKFHLSRLIEIRADFRFGFFSQSFDLGF